MYLGQWTKELGQRTKELGHWTKELGQWTKDLGQCHQPLKISNPVMSNPPDIDSTLYFNAPWFNSKLRIKCTV